MIVWQVLVVVALNIVLMIAATFLMTHSIGGAIKAVKVALKSEFTTDTGRLNLVGMILLVFVMVFFGLHATLGDALSVEHPAPSEYQVLAPMVLFGLGFVCSMICVLAVERKDDEK
jgi:hypothetical protein